MIVPDAYPLPFGVAYIGLSESMLSLYQNPAVVAVFNTPSVYLSCSQFFFYYRIGYKGSFKRFAFQVFSDFRDSPPGFLLGLNGAFSPFRFKRFLLGFGGAFTRETGFVKLGLNLRIPVRKIYGPFVFSLLACASKQEDVEKWIGAGLALYIKTRRLFNRIYIGVGTAYFLENQWAYAVGTGFEFYLKGLKTRFFTGFQPADRIGCGIRMDVSPFDRIEASSAYFTQEKKFRFAFSYHRYFRAGAEKRAILRRLFSKVRSYYRAKDYTKAKALLEFAKVISPRSRSIYYWERKIKRAQMRRKGPAKKVSPRIIQRQKVLHQQALELYAQEKYEEARAKWMEVFKLAPDTEYGKLAADYIDKIDFILGKQMESKEESE